MFYKNFLFILGFLNFFLNINSRAIHSEETENNINNNKFNSEFCQELSTKMLAKILGPAYNSRYMSINEPKYSEDDNDELNEEINIKRRANHFLSFYVDDKYALELSDQPAWEYDDYIQNDLKLRSKRSNMKGGNNNGGTKRPWECEAKIHWIDLGPDYFPRYLRTIECTKHLCWYGHYSCQPRSFTVKILRRRHGKCASLKKNIRISNHELPDELRELWIWEERAVNFCCDCAARL